MGEGKQEIANRKQKRLIVSLKEKLFNIINAVERVLTSMLFLSAKEISLTFCNTYNYSVSRR